MNLAGFLTDLAKRGIAGVRPKQPARFRGGGGGRGKRAKAKSRFRGGGGGRGKRAKAKAVATATPTPAATATLSYPKGSSVFPPGAARGPRLTDPGGIAVAPDGSVVVAGPRWWDALGESSQGLGALPLEAKLALLLEEHYPHGGASPPQGKGATLLFEEIRRRLA